MRKTNHKLFACFLIGSLGAWYFFSTAPYPKLAVPIVIVWAILSLKDKVSA